MFRKLHIGHIGWLLAAVVSAITAASTTGRSEPAIDQRWHALKHIHVEYTSKRSYTLLPPGSDGRTRLADGRIQWVDVGEHESTHVYRRKGSAVRYERAISGVSFDRAGSSDVLEPRAVVRTFVPGRNEQLDVPLKPGPASGVIRARDSMPIDTIEAALGLRLEGMDELWEDVLGRAQVVTEGDVRTIHFDDNRGRRHVLSLDLSRGGVARSYEIYAGSFRNIEVRVDAVQKIGETWIPSRVTRRLFMPVGEASRETLREVVEVTKVLVDPPDDPEAFTIVWPEGTRVLDARTVELRRPRRGEEVVRRRPVRRDGPERGSAPRGGA